MNKNTESEEAWCRFIGDNPHLKNYDETFFMEIECAFLSGWDSAKISAFNK